MAGRPGKGDKAGKGLSPSLWMMLNVRLKCLHVISWAVGSHGRVSSRGVTSLRSRSLAPTSGRERAAPGAGMAAGRLGGLGSSATDQYFEAVMVCLPLKRTVLQCLRGISPRMGSSKVSAPGEGSTGLLTCSSQ